MKSNSGGKNEEAGAWVSYKEWKGSEEGATEGRRVIQRRGGEMGVGWLVIHFLWVSEIGK